MDFLQCNEPQVIDENVSLLIYALTGKLVWCKVLKPGRDIGNVCQM